MTVESLVCDDFIPQIHTLPHARHFTAVGQLLKTPEQWHRFEWDRFTAYHRAIDELAGLLLGDVDYLFQREPNLRIHPTAGTCVPWHTDAEFGHLEAEWNCWSPLTEISDPTQQIWLSTEDGLHYPPFVAVGHVLCFRGAVVEHGNRTNLSSERRSFDFRIIAADDYRDRGLRTVEYGVPLREPDYWTKGLGEARGNRPRHERRPDGRAGPGARGRGT